MNRSLPALTALLTLTTLTSVAGCRRETSPTVTPEQNEGKGKSTAEGDVPPEGCSSAADCASRAVGFLDAGAFDKSLPLFDYACHHGFADSCYSLGVLLRSGEVAEDPVMAHGAATEGCELGHQGACVHLGLDLLLGNGASNLTSSNQVSWLSGKGELPPNPVACPRDVLFSRQIEVDSFPIKYPDCKEIQGNLIVYEISANGDPVIYDLSPLLGVHTVHGGVYLYRSFLPNMHGLDSLRTIGRDLEIKGGYVLTSLEGLDNLQSIGGNLVIRQNESLTFQAKLKNLHGLENLERVGGDFIQQERNLLSLEGLDKLRIIGGNFDIQKGKLQSLLGLEALDTIGKSLVLANLPNLKSLSGLQNLHHAGLNLSTDSLPDLQGLENLRSGRELRLTSNKNLQRLTGLENLEQLTGYNRNTLAKYPVIWLANNQALSDLSALDHDLDVDDDGIYILNNAALSQCAAQAICAYLPTEPDTVSIAGNLPACESDVAILASCQLLNTGAPSDNVGYWVFPNPISSAEQLTVVWQSDFNGPVKLELLSLEGRVLKTIIREKFADQITETIPISERLPRQFTLRVSDGRYSAIRLVVKL